jgi:hypothetical protein
MFDSHQAAQGAALLALNSLSGHRVCRSDETYNSMRVTTMKYGLIGAAVVAALALGAGTASAQHGRSHGHSHGHHHGYSGPGYGGFYTPPVVSYAPRVVIGGGYASPGLGFGGGLYSPAPSYGFGGYSTPSFGHGHHHHHYHGQGHGRRW